jgi:Na+/H+ antiporter NhaD/arsenite permease-like protein
MEIASSILAMALVVVGLIGQGFEMKKIRSSIKTDEQLNPKNVFLDKRNFKWYALIGTGLILSFVKF